MFGWLFDKLNITGDWDMQLWGALSKAYAEAATEQTEKREYHIFMGHNKGRAPTTNNIWSQVESKVVDAAAKRNPKIKIAVHAVIPPKLEASKRPPTVGKKDCFWSSGFVAPSAVEGARTTASSKANAIRPKDK